MTQLNLIDIGANLAHKSFSGDLEPVCERAVAAGVCHMIVTGTSLQASQRAHHVAQRRPKYLSSTAGVHPHEARNFDDQTLAGLRALCRHPSVLAVGECGLDFNRNFSSPEDQERAFLAQIELAVELQMPLFTHEREAHDHFVAIVREHRDRLRQVVVHCFTGTQAEARAYLDLDLHLGITGWICDERRGLHLREVVQQIPPDRLMLETDSPFLLPRDLKPKPRSRRNEPEHLPHILRAVADARGEDAEDLARQTSTTARSFFGLEAQ